MRKFFSKIGLTLGLLAQLSFSGIAEAKGSPEYVQKYFTALAAASCLGVYMPKDSVEFNYLRSYGWNIAPQVAKDGKVESNFAIASHYYPKDKQLVFLVTFRGSATKGDWEINLKTKKVNFGGNNFAEMQALANEPLVKQGPAVHKGFNTYIENVMKNSVLNEGGSLKGVFQVVKERPDAYLIITGHSLGGAAATLLGQRLIDMGLPREKFQVITFGAPAIANDAFVKNYGDRIKLTRVVNPNDPVPGSLQTFFNGYKQFGESLKYQLPYRVSSVQHAMALYFDQSVSNYHKQLDIETAAGRIEKHALRKYTENKPLVALWFEVDPTLLKQPYGDDVRKLVMYEYTRMLPSRAVMSEGSNLGEKRYKNLEMEAKEVGADYILVCGIEAQRLQDQNYWYQNLTQTIYDKDGNMLNMSVHGKKVGSAMSAVQATGENMADARKELLKALPFVKIQHKGKSRDR